MGQGKAYPEIKRDTAVGPWKIQTDTTALQACNEDHNVGIAAESLDDLVAMVKCRIASQVEKAPLFTCADTADDTCEKTKLDVDNNLVGI